MTTQTWMMEMMMIIRVVAKEWKAMSQSTMMAWPVKTSKMKTMQAFSIEMKLMLKLSKKIEIVQKEWQFLKERSPIICTHQLHIMIDLAKTLKMMRMSISVKIIMLLST